MPSRPGESHPEPLTDPDLTLSRHPARATERRLPPSVKNWSSSCYQLAHSDVDDLLPLLHGHYPVSSLLRSSPPLAGASVLSASRVRRLRLFPWHRRPGSQVPYESPNESHASYTPDTTWPVGRFPPRSSWNKGTAPVSMSHEGFDASSEVRLRSSLSSIPDGINVPPFDHDVHHRGFCPKQLMAVWSLPLQDGSEGSSFISRTA
jgi:hypothetical protein